MATELRTEHPHVVRIDGVAGGRPVIAGTRISVGFIARLLQVGDTPADIIAAYSHLSPAAVYDAVSCYLDHQDEIDASLDADSPAAVERALAVTVGGAGSVTFGSTLA